MCNNFFISDYQHPFIICLMRLLVVNVIYFFLTWFCRYDAPTSLENETSKFFEKGFPTNQNFTILEK